MAYRVPGLLPVKASFHTCYARCEYTGKAREPFEVEIVLQRIRCMSIGTV